MHVQIEQPVTPEEHLLELQRLHGARLHKRILCLVRDPLRAEEVEVLTWERVWFILSSSAREMNYGYLWKIVMSVVNDLWRKEYRHVKHAAFSLDNPSPGMRDDEGYQAGDTLLSQTVGEDTLDLLIERENREEDRALVKRLIMPLSEIQRACVLSHAHGELPRECATRLEIAVSRVYNARRNGMEKLRRRQEWRMSYTRGRPERRAAREIARKEKVS